MHTESKRARSVVIVAWHWLVDTPPIYNYLLYSELSADEAKLLLD